MLSQVNTESCENSLVHVPPVFLNQSIAVVYILTLSKKQGKLPVYHKVNTERKTTNYGQNYGQLRIINLR